MGRNNSIETISVNGLLSMNLRIPPYQRPYKWTVKNMEELINDINNSINDYEFFKEGFKYRIGTIILHKRSDDNYDIVDGQQRIISLLLIKLQIENNFKCTILEECFTNKVTQKNIQDNYAFVREYFSIKDDDFKKKFIDSFEKILQVVVICVQKISEAFQLFDSQNTRGKTLDPHDLLKAYHLREMNNDIYEMRYVVIKWEAQKSLNIKKLFDEYLYPIWNWARCIKSRPFTEKEIDTYKGIELGTGYYYAKRASNAMPYFQITESFIAGKDFFGMVDYYLRLLEDVKSEINNNKKFLDIKSVVNDKKNNSTGFEYAKQLFYCVLLYYYDKFHNFDELIVKKLFVWAFMIRLDMKLLGFDTINKYAIGATGNYTNMVDMFRAIDLARRHNDISRISIKLDKPKADKWNRLYEKMVLVSGMEVVDSGEQV